MPTVNIKKEQVLMLLNPRDNVAVTLRDIADGETLSVKSLQVTAIEAIARGHKIALDDLNENEDIIKYGYPIGHATSPVKKGAWIHTHNAKTNLCGEEEYEYIPDLHPVTYEKRDLTFDGYCRSNGKVGIRNDLYIVPTVGCVNGIAGQILNRFKELYPDYTQRFDNVTILSHPYGCSQLGDDHAWTRQILLDAVCHPNAGGVLVLGLGCENNIVSEFEKLLGDYDKSRVKFLIAQDVDDEVEDGTQLLTQLYDVAKDDKREPVPISELNIGLKCGGSDGFSGITANPLLGVFSDFLVSQGGSTVLTEVPEMFGAEKVLMGRAKDKEVFTQIVDLINDFKAYFLSYNEPVYENPSPGNKAGGITTLEDKSLGCTQKSGTSAVIDVLQYGEKIQKKGLSLLQAPGNDLVASSALASSDCHMVLFTTGRGTPFGSYVPTAKIATNTQIFEKKGHWMDFDAGVLLERSMEDVLEDFIQFVIDIASGKLTHNEKNEIRELAIFKNGVTL